MLLYENVRCQAPYKMRVGVLAVVAALSASTIVAPPLAAQSSGATFACDPGFYQVISGQLAELDPANNTYNAIGADGASYNAMGYRIADGYIYGIQGSNLIRIDASGSVSVMHTLNIPSGSYTGDFGDDGLLHVSRGGRSWYAVDVDTGQATAIPELSGNVGVADITNVYGKFYGVSGSGQLIRFNVDAKTVTNVGAVSGLPGGSLAFGAAWSSAGGNLYVGRNSGEIFQITGYSTGSPVATQVATASATNSNDGASCSLAAAPAGIPDVDGPQPETPPSTPEGQQAAENYAENEYETYTFPSAPVEEGASCTTGFNEDRPVRLAVNADSVIAPTVAYASGASVSLSDFDVLSGLWTEDGAAIRQTHDCGYDYTALLRAEPLNHYRWEATVAGVNGVNQGGVVVNQSSPLTRSGAALIDLADGGNVLRWGVYNSSGYYQLLGAVDLDPSAATSARFSIEVHGDQVTVLADGEFITTFASDGAGGHVGLVTSRAAGSFSDLKLTALPMEMQESQPIEVGS